MKKTPTSERRRSSFTGMLKGSSKKLVKDDPVEDEVAERRKSISMVKAAAEEEQERLVDEGECASLQTKRILRTASSHLAGRYLICS